MLLYPLDICPLYVSVCVCVLNQIIFDDIPDNKVISAWKETSCNLVQIFQLVLYSHL